jgi:hypothetical protein
VSAHYDSQVVSYGATDAGMGLMAAIEILRQISRQGAPRLQNDGVCASSGHSLDDVTAA